MGMRESQVIEREIAEQKTTIAEAQKKLEELNRELSFVLGDPILDQVSVLADKKGRLFQRDERGRTKKL